jgi:argininosuccinate lyase
MSRLWDKGIDLDQRVLAYTAGDDYALDERLVQYDVRASIAHAEMLNAQKLLAGCGPACDPRRPRRHRCRTRRGQWKIDLADEDGQTALEKRSPRASAPPAGACTWAARAMTRS